MAEGVKAIIGKLMASKRLIALTLVLVLLMGVGNASADFEPTGTDPAVGTTEATPSPEPPPSEDPGNAEGAGGGGNVNHEVVVINTVDGRAASRAGVGVARVVGEDVHNQNAAAATSSCNDCRTVAVAAQAVIIQRTDATTIAPKNVAVAINAECVRCETFAAAYQFVFTTDGIVRFDVWRFEKELGEPGGHPTAAPVRPATPAPIP